MALLDRFKKKKQDSLSMEWEEIKIDQPAPPQKPSGDKEVDYALKGRMGVLETHSLLQEFTSRGWDEVSNHIEPMVFGKVSSAPWALAQVFAAFPKESSEFLSDYKEIPHKILILLLAEVGGEQRDMVKDILIEVIPNLSPDDLPGALEVLGRYPSAEGNKVLGDYLNSDRWTVAMKAATAIEAAGAVEFLPRMREIQAQGGLLGDALGEIIQRMG